MMMELFKDERKKYDISNVVVAFLTVAVIFPLAILGCFMPSTQHFAVSVIGIMSGVVATVLGSSHIRTAVTKKRPPQKVVFPPVDSRGA